MVFLLPHWLCYCCVVYTPADTFHSLSLCSLSISIYFWIYILPLCCRTWIGITYCTSTHQYLLLLVERPFWRRWTFTNVVIFPFKKSRCSKGYRNLHGGGGGAAAAAVCVLYSYAGLFWPVIVYFICSGVSLWQLYIVRSAEVVYRKERQMWREKQRIKTTFMTVVSSSKKEKSWPTSHRTHSCTHLTVYIVYFALPSTLYLLYSRSCLCQ